MPFNIELLSSPLSMKFQVVKSVITVYFYGPEDLAFPTRDRWRELVQPIFSELPEFESADRIDKDISINVYHQKKDHTTTQERKIPHVHMHHRVEVTPEMFSLFIKKAYAQQKLKGEEYQFFSGIEEVDYITRTFASYYSAYKGSSIERLYEEETTLTDAEIEEHIDEIVALVHRNTAMENDARRSALGFFQSMPPALFTTAMSTPRETHYNGNA